jgi:HAD superfamily hydrolase (TIGR01509 family)
MNFVFDLGNVMVYFQPDSYLERLGYGDERIPALREAIFMSDAWLACDAGTMTRAEETEAMCAAHPELEADIRRIMARCDEMLAPIPASVRALERLTREGYDCYYLSNTNEPALDFMAGFDYFRLFKGGVASYAERMAKPDPAIFRLFAARFGLEPGECVFVDDNAANVESARACGFQARRLCDPNGLEELVDAVLHGKF